MLLTKDRTRLVQCPAGKLGRVAIPESVIGIETSAFSGCAGLTGIAIPEGVT